MIKSMEFIHYRNLKNIEFNFSKGINIISGVNGTCKSSILYLISNSFKSLNKTNTWIKDKNSIDIIKSINKNFNPKIESLTKGDKTYNNPAPGTNGVLLKCSYFDGTSLDFRRHNSTNNSNHRFSIKPPYKKGTNQSLNAIPIIYLGLFRLYPFGEFENDSQIKSVTKELPDIYKEELSDLYYSFTGVKIVFEKHKIIGNIKVRSDFKSKLSENDSNTISSGIDSNTISSGEDNLLIILNSLVSLKYYYESIDTFRDVESILLIDELDASLHPDFQIKLYKIFKEYSELYKIQIFFTTHSLTLIKYLLEKKANLFYLLKGNNYVYLMEDPDINQITMNLNDVTRKEIYLDNKIPIISEDAEARTFLKEIFNYYNKTSNINLESFFYLSNSKLGSDNIISIFKDPNLKRTALRAVAVLDGDKNNKSDLSNHIIILPGEKSPEDLFFEYSKLLYNNNVGYFWNNSVLQSEGYFPDFYRNNILEKIENITKTINELISKDEPTKGVKRKMAKDIFNEYNVFWKYVIKDWVENTENKDEINKFLKNLNIVFKKTADFYSIIPKVWDFTNI